MKKSKNPKKTKDYVTYLSQKHSSKNKDNLVSSPFSNLNKTREKPKFRTSSSEPMSTPSVSRELPQVKKKVIFKKVNSSASDLISSSDSVNSKKHIFQRASSKVRFKTLASKHTRGPGQRKSPQERSRRQRFFRKKTNSVKPKKANNKSASVVSMIRKKMTLGPTCIRKLEFQKLVRRYTDQHTRTSSSDRSARIRMTKQALMALQVATEMKIIRLVEDAYMCTLHAKRVTLMQKDLVLAKKISGFE